MTNGQSGLFSSGARSTDRSRSTSDSGSGGSKIESAGPCCRGGGGGGGGGEGCDAGAEGSDAGAERPAEDDPADTVSADARLQPPRGSRCKTRRCRAGGSCGHRVRRCPATTATREPLQDTALTGGRRRNRLAALGPRDASKQRKRAGHRLVPLRAAVVATLREGAGRLGVAAAETAEAAPLELRGHPPRGRRPGRRSHPRGAQRGAPALDAEEALTVRDAELPRRVRRRRRMSASRGLLTKLRACGRRASSRQGLPHRF